MDAIATAIDRLHSIPLGQQTEIERTLRNVCFDLAEAISELEDRLRQLEQHKEHVNEYIQSQL